MVVRESDMAVSAYTTRTGAAAAIGCSRDAIRGDNGRCKGYIYSRVKINRAKKGFALCEK